MKLIEHIDSNNNMNKEVLIELVSDGVVLTLEGFQKALGFLGINDPKDSMNVSMDNDYISIKKENSVK